MPASHGHVLGCVCAVVVRAEPGSPWLLAGAMTQPEDWLEELLGFSEDGSRRWFPPCKSASIPERPASAHTTCPIGVALTSDA